MKNCSKKLNSMYVWNQNGFQSAQGRLTHFSFSACLQMLSQMLFWNRQPSRIDLVTVQRGFAALDMSSDELKCSDIVYNSSEFYSLQPIHVLLTINHGGQTNGLVHDVRMFSCLKSFEISYFVVKGTFLLISSSHTEKSLLKSLFTSCLISIYRS